MWSAIGAIDRNVNERGNSPNTIVSLLLLSFTFIYQFQRVQSLSLSTRDNIYRSQGPYFCRVTCQEKRTDDRLESTSYPACAWTNPRQPSSTKSLLELTAKSQRRRFGDSDDNIDNNNNNNNNKNANSKSTIFPGYNFFKRSGRRIGESNYNDKDTAGRKGYVPSGMSQAEYSAIRKIETEREQKMNYGGWGPRFRRTDRPDGDWMTIPNLWTFGRIDNNSKRNNDNVDGENNGARHSIRRRIQSLAQTHGTSFLLGYVLVDSLYAGYALWKFKQIQDSIILRKTRGLAYAVFSLILTTLGTFAGLSSKLQILTPPVARNMIKSTIRGPARATLIKINALKIAVAMLQIPLWNGLMERANRRWLWSKNRFAMTITSAAMTGLTIFGIILFR
jgi:hypothetical protein